jgi:hypothetical protein
MGLLRIAVAVFCLFVGIGLTSTIIGAIIGLPLVVVGIYLIYKEQRLRAREVISGGIKDGIAEALKERDKEK